VISSAARSRARSTWRSSPAVTLWITAAAAADVIRDGIRTVTDTQVWDESGVYVFGLFTGDLGRPARWPLRSCRGRLATTSGCAPVTHARSPGRGGRLVSRLYLYGAALYAIFATLTASANLIETGLRMPSIAPPIDQASDWWALAVTGALAQSCRGRRVGRPLATRCGSGAMPDWRGAAERVSRVRATYLMAVVLASTSR